MVMARSFRPPTSGLYGQADRAAALQLSATAMAMLQNLSDEEIAAEDSRQVANAMAALEGERGKLNAYMDENPDKADQWGDWFAGEREGIGSRVMAGITQPGARDKVQNALTGTFADWSASIANRRRDQIRKNDITDYNLRFDKYASERVHFEDIDHLIDRLSIASEDIDGASARGLISDGQAAAQKDAVTTRMIGDFTLQDMIAQGNPDLADDANIYAAGFGLPEDTFDKADIKKLRDEYDAHEKAVKDTVKKEQEERKSTELARLTPLLEAGDALAVFRHIDTLPIGIEERDQLRKNAISIMDTKAKTGKFAEDSGEVRRLTAEVYSPKATTREDLNKAVLGDKGQKPTISPETFRTLMGTLDSDVPESDVTKKYISLLDDMFNVPTDYSEDKLKQMGLTKDQAKQASGGITIFQWQAGYNAVRAMPPDIEGDPVKAQAYWNDSVMPAMFTAEEEETGISFFDKVMFGLMGPGYAAFNVRRKGKKPAYQKGDRIENAQGDPMIYDGELWQPAQ